MNKNNQIAHLERLALDYDIIQKQVMVLPKPEITYVVRDVTFTRKGKPHTIPTKFAIMGDVEVEATGYYIDRLTNYLMDH